MPKKPSVFFSSTSFQTMFNNILSKFKKLALFYRRLAGLLITAGLIGFLGGVIYSFSNLNLASIEFPLSFPQSIVADSKGRIYCGSEFYSRIQVYNARGKFLNGWNTCAGSKGFRVSIDEYDNLHVITYVGSLERVYNSKGTLLQTNEMHIEPSQFYFDSSRYHYEDKKGNIYKIKGFIFHRIVRIDAKGINKVIVSPPLLLNLFSFPFCGFIFAAGVLIYSKNYYNYGKSIPKKRKSIHKEIKNETDFDIPRGQLSQSHTGIYWFSWLISLIIAFSLKSFFRNRVNLALMYMFLIWGALIIIRFYEDFRFVKYMKEYYPDKWNELLKIWGSDNLFANLCVVKLLLSSRSAKDVVFKHYKRIRRQLSALFIIVFLTSLIVFLVITSPPWAVAIWTIIKLIISGDLNSLLELIFYIKKALKRWYYFPSLRTFLSYQ